MDRTLLNTQTDTRNWPQQSRLPGFTRWLPAIALLAVNLGCQSSGLLPNRLATSELPVPPSRLDTRQLENVRFQDPGDDRAPAVYASGIGSAQVDAQPLSDAEKANLVSEVVVTGNTRVPTHHLMRNIRTRPGRFFDPDKLQQDVDELWRMPEISRINGPFINRTPAGVVVSIEVVERVVIDKVEFVGNRGIPDRTLQKETGLEDGNPLDVHEIRMAKTKIEELYKEKGYPRTQVEVLEGNEVGDSKVVFLIHEDEKQRIWKVEFEGNTIATDARLKNFIQSKPGILKVFGGLVKRNEIDQDVTRLTNYYRSLGFFNARIGREVSESNDGRWMTVRFIVNEGPRYRVRNVAFIGNSAYTQEQLVDMLQLKPDAEGQPEFNVAKMNQDVVELRDLYGSQGFAFAKVEAEPRFLEEPGLLDIVYKIDEGKRFRVGSINVHFEGGGGITKREVVINRIGLQPGDWLDAREIRNSERRLGAAQIFAGPDTPGARGPRIVVMPPELRALERSARSETGSTFY